MKKDTVFYAVSFVLFACLGLTYSPNFTFSQPKDTAEDLLLIFTVLIVLVTITNDILFFPK